MAAGTPRMRSNCSKSLSPYVYMLSEGQKVSMDVHPDAVITEDFYLDANEVVHVVIGQEEEEKLVALQKILNEND